MPPDEPSRPPDDQDGPGRGRDGHAGASTPGPRRWPLRPWELARSVDADARALSADPRAGRGAHTLAVVGGVVVLRSCALVLLAGVLVPVLPADQSPWVGGAGLLGAVAYAGLYLRASTGAARHTLLASLRRGYRFSLCLLVLAAGVGVRVVGVRLGWVPATPPPPSPGWFAAAALVAVHVQTLALRRRARRGR